MFIVIEGLDGAGKSTQANFIRDAYAKKGIVTEYLHFPRFDSPLYGELIARFLRGELGKADEVNPWLVALIYAGDRKEAAPVIQGWLAEGKTVLIDRYVYSNIAYQCAKVPDAAERDKLQKWILDIEYVSNAIPKPDLTLFLDVPFEFTAKKLAEQREGCDRDYLKGKKDIHEASLSLQERVRNVYLSQTGDMTFHVVDCSDGHGRMLPPAEIFNNMSKLIFP